MKTKKKPRKNQTPRRTSGHATQAAWTPGRASLAIHRSRETWGSREPSYATWVVRAWPRDSGCATWVSRPGSCDSGRTTWVVRPGSHDLGRAMQAARPGPRELFLSLSDLVSLPLIWFDFFSLSLIWSYSVRWGCTWDLKFLKFFWFINRVLETRFWSGHYVEKDDTSDVIKP